jgi:hypothetical protein
MDLESGFGIEPPAIALGQVLSSSFALLTEGD